MTRKTTDKKSAARVTTADPRTVELDKLLRLGNYFSARRIAKKMATEDAEHARIAQKALRITWPDKMALLAGIISLLVIIIVAFVVAY
jgi:hypothetical protein